MLWCQWVHPSLVINKRRRYCYMSFNTGIYSSTMLLEEIKELIKDESLTQERFADEIGYSRKAFNRFINGKNKNTDFGLIIKLCKRLGIKVITIE